jgi:hypothetical protein
MQRTMCCISKPLSSKGAVITHTGMEVRQLGKAIERDYEFQNLRLAHRAADRRGTERTEWRLRAAPGWTWFILGLKDCKLSSRPCTGWCRISRRLLCRVLGVSDDLGSGRSGAGSRPRSLERSHLRDRRRPVYRGAWSDDGAPLRDFDWRRGAGMVAQLEPVAAISV